MARTTPAQKPRGEHSNTRSGGLPIESVAADGTMGIAPRALESRCTRNGPQAPSLSSCDNVTSAGLDSGSAGAYIPRTSVIVDDSGFARTAGGAQRGFCHDQPAADAEGDRRMAGREHRAFLRADRGVLQIA